MTQEYIYVPLFENANEINSDESINPNDYSILDNSLLPEEDEDLVFVSFPEHNITLNEFVSYSFTKNWLHASSSFQLEVATQAKQEIIDKVQNGSLLLFEVNGVTVFTGYVDVIEIKYSRNGSFLFISGRDALSPTIDASINPRYKFNDSKTLQDLMLSVFKPYGFEVVINNDAIAKQKLTKIQPAITYQKAAGFEFSVVQQKTLRVYKETTLPAMNVPINAKMKPHPNESVYEFAERIAKRFGTHITCDAEGKQIILGTPDYNQKPSYYLRHQKFESSSLNNNILESNVVFDWSQQPAIIIAESHVNGSLKWDRKCKRVYMINELIADEKSINELLTKIKKELDGDEVPAIDSYPNGIRPYVVAPKYIQKRTNNKFLKVSYVYDDESRTLNQLKNYVKRQMGEAQSLFFKANFKVNRHSFHSYEQQNIGERAIYTPNTMISVQDETTGINQLLWVESVTMTKSRNGGTVTDLTCTLPFTFELYSEEV